MVPSSNNRSKRPRYTRAASIKSNAAKPIDKPRQGLVCRPPKRRPVKTRAPPVTTTNRVAIKQATTASISNQPAMSCQAGSVNR